jgi:hypothetical protein
MAHKRFDDNLPCFPLFNEITVNPRFLNGFRQAICFWILPEA